MLACSLARRSTPRLKVSFDEHESRVLEERVLIEKTRELIQVSMSLPQHNQGVRGTSGNPGRWPGGRRQLSNNEKPPLPRYPSGLCFCSERRAGKKHQSDSCPQHVTETITVASHLNGSPAGFGDPTSGPHHPQASCWCCMRVAPGVLSLSYHSCSALLPLAISTLRTRFTCSARSPSATTRPPSRRSSSGRSRAPSGSLPGRNPPASRGEEGEVRRD